jgi:threonine/homoserine/homoserine lactone efflux protein
MDFGLWLVYLVASVGLALTPGPNGMLALTHGAIHGVRKTIGTISGGVLGFGLVIAMSMFGIGALLAASAQLLIAMKWIGGAYLVYLGIQIWRSPAIGIDQGKSQGSVNVIQLFRSGFLTAVTNPKAILFFVAFLPQFIDANRNLGIQFLILAATYMVVEFLYELVVATLADRIKPFLQRIGKKLNRVLGSVFVVIGIALPLRG